MVTQHIVLDMTPGTKPIVNVSQYDTGARTLVFHLRQNRQTFTPLDGCTAILHGIKPDSTYFSYSAEIDGDTVVADCTEQMTACVGFAECEVRLSNSEGHVGSANFLLNCEKSPMTGAVISESVIAAAEQLTDRAEQAASSATSSATAAEESAEQAGESATDAEESADRAAREAETASHAAEDAGESATAAAESASSASGSEASARQYSAAAEGFANDAENSAQGAAQDAQTASAKASEAAASADRASGSAVDSANAASLASGYADTAQAQAQAAEVSATNAAGSASTAQAAAGTATQKAGEASNSATAANTSAGQAASYASAASTSAETASEKATQAGESATNAANSASAAAGSASDASDSAAAALSSEQAVAQSAADIAASATQIQTNTDNIAALQIVESTSAADITSIDDGADGVPMKSLKVYIEPVQDLHGYDNPWPAGGGKNIASPEVSQSSTLDLANNNGVFSVTRVGNVTSNPRPYFTKKFEDIGLIEGETYTAYCYDPAQNGYGCGIYNGRGGMSVLDIHESAHTFVYSASTMSTWRLGVWSNSPNDLPLNTTIYFHAVLVKGSTAPSVFLPYENICPISGWDSVETVRTEVNIWDEEWKVVGDHIGSKNPIPCVPNTTYIMVSPAQPSNGIKFYTADMVKTGATRWNKGTFTTPADARYMTFEMTNAYGTTYNHDISINYPSTDTDYHPYEGRTITTDLPSTVYGGVLDVVMGELTVDRAMVDLGTLTWNYINFAGGIFASNGITSLVANGSECVSSAYRNLAGGSSVIQNNDGIVFINSNESGGAITGGAGAKNIVITDRRFTSAADFAAAVAGQTLVYSLATPTTYTLTPEEVKTLLKQNNVFADAGQTAIVYVADPKTYIDNSIADAVASLT